MKTTLWPGYIAAKSAASFGDTPLSEAAVNATTVPSEGVKTGAGVLVTAAGGAAVVMDAAGVCVIAGTVVVGIAVVAIVVATVVDAGWAGDDEAHPAKSAVSIRILHTVLMKMKWLAFVFMVDLSFYSNRGLSVNNFLFSFQKINSL